MIKNHIEFLLSSDPIFAEYWRQKSASEKSKSIAFASEIDHIDIGRDDLSKYILELADRSRRFFSCVPQKDMDYGRRPADWLDFVQNESEKKEHLDLSSRHLRSFLGGSNYHGSTRLYGNIKSIESLDDKLGELKLGSDARRTLRDTWDAVRFRIVCKDLFVARAMAVEIWQWYFDDIVKCRNYYMYPSNDIEPDPYGAVHLEIEITEGRWIELQLLTEGRDLAGFLDHALMHKKNIAFTNASHERWLRSFRQKVFIWDCEKIPMDELRIPDV